MGVRTNVRLSLSRRLAQAAVALTEDDPNRSVTVEAIVKRLRLPRNEGTVTALAEAIERRWLVPNQGRDLHTVKIGPQWRRDRGRA